MAKQPLSSSGFQKLSGTGGNPICPRGKILKEVAPSQVRGLSGSALSFLPSLAATTCPSQATSQSLSCVPRRPQVRSGLDKEG